MRLVQLGVGTMTTPEEKTFWNEPLRMSPWCAMILSKDPIFRIPEERVISR